MTGHDEADLRRSFRRAYGDPAEYSNDVRRQAVRRPWLATGMAAAAVVVLVVGITLTGNRDDDRSAVPSVVVTSDSSDSALPSSTSLGSHSSEPPASLTDPPLPTPVTTASPRDSTDECERSQLYDREGGSFRVDKSWEVSGAVVCGYGGLVHVADRGIWRTTAEWDVRESDLPALIELLNQREIEAGMDDGICGASSRQIAGIVMTLEDGSKKVFPQPQLGCTSGPENEAIAALAAVGTSRLFAQFQERTELEIALGCSREWEGGLEYFRTKGGKEITPPPGDAAICVYQDTKRDSPLVASGRATKADLADLWTSVLPGKSEACAEPSKKWMSIGAPRPESVPTGRLIEDEGFLALQPWSAIVEIGGCNRVYDARARYLGTADGDAVVHAAGLADTPSTRPETEPSSDLPDLSAIVVLPDSRYSLPAVPTTSGG